jgi:hypothetical protein
MVGKTIFDPPNNEVFMGSCGTFLTSLLPRTGKSPERTDTKELIPISRRICDCPGKKLGVFDISMA